MTKYDDWTHEDWQDRSRQELIQLVLGEAERAAELEQRAAKGERFNKLIEAFGMFSENMQRQHLGHSMAYADTDFFELLPHAIAAALDEGKEAPDA